MGSCNLSFGFFDISVDRVSGVHFKRKKFGLKNVGRIGLMLMLKKEPQYIFQAKTQGNWLSFESGPSSPPPSSRGPRRSCIGPRVKAASAASAVRKVSLASRICTSRKSNRLSRCQREWGINYELAKGLQGVPSSLRTWVWG